MKAHRLSAAVVSVVLVLVSVLSAEIRVVVGHHPPEDAVGGFVLPKVPPPSQSDAAQKASVILVDGRRDRNGARLDVLNDGQVPTDEDQPGRNFFFAANTDGGRLLVDLDKAIAIEQINTYSWHPGSRGPQVYALYASDGSGAGFAAQPKKGTDPRTCGWALVAKVDTRPEQGAGGGQYGVSIRDTVGNLGTYRYLLFDIARTESDDPFGNTFYSEIDVVDPTSPVVPVEVPKAGEGAREVVEIDGGKYQIVIDTTETPDLTKWAHEELAPVVQKWYPRLVAMLPSEGYDAPAKVTITFSANMRGVAATGGSRVRCAATWFRTQLIGEAKGAIVHELVHVVQSYGRSRRTNPNATRPPGWLVEGIADYIRWFLYEPHTHGAEITARNIDRARYDASYRVSGNFLHWVTNTCDKDIVRKLNAAAREGRYAEQLWSDATGKTLQELGDEWQAVMKEKVAAEEAGPKPNTLTDEERAAGWKLLFDGSSFDGWHTFKREDVRPGWRVRGGALVCADPHNAGDLCTDAQYDWFELQIDYTISEAGNSGIMYRVTDEGGAAWATGPEFQLEDNTEASDPVRCGWLYALYQPPVDPATGKPLDATKPVGRWNHVRLLISPERCEHEINGVKYFDYVLGSDDFKGRVAQSKFRRMPLFARFDKGYIALQGDHGQVSFRNIKIRPIPVEK
ncbi:MAG: DUF1080 domain-containing protein [Phycisphaerales bacterium]|nr:MAG: DUF1080 domain-containing protein [Phycisphaerales bacterium]